MVVRAPLDAALFVTDLILGYAGVAARLTVDAVRLLGFGGWFITQTGTHELLTRIAGHALRLCIAVRHSLLLRVDLRVEWQRRSDIFSSVFLAETAISITTDCSVAGRSTCSKYRCLTVSSASGAMR